MTCDISNLENNNNEYQYSPKALSGDKLDDQATFDPNHLLDALIKKFHLKNDAALCRFLEIAPPIVSKIRHRRLPVGASLLIRMHEESDLTIVELRALMGDNRKKFGIRDEHVEPNID